MSTSRSFVALAGLVAFGLFGAACSATSDPESGESTPPEEVISPLTAAPGISIAEIALYQGVKRPIVQGGVPAVTQIPIVAGRDAMLRVFVQSDGSFPGALTGRLYLGASKDAVEVTSTLSQASNDGDLASTLNFEIPGDALRDPAAYRLEIGQLGGPSGAPPALAYPAEGSEPIPLQSVGEKLKITIVPIQYNADGSGRLPDISEGQIALYQQGFAAMYPVPQVEITVRAPFPYSGSVGASGNGWENLLSAVADLRMSDGVAPDVYYYAPFAPANSENQFCGGGCVAGLGITGGPSDAFGRAAVGLGFSGELSVSTALHEVGHNHGRLHSPCQTYDADPAYPYPNGTDGVWGYDRAHQVLFPPTAADIMGYCQPSWISDWTFMAFLERIRAVNQLTGMLVHGAPDGAPGQARIYDRARIDGAGKLHPMAPLTLRVPPSAEARAVRLDDGREVTAQFYPYDHLPGGLLIWER